MSGGVWALILACLLWGTTGTAASFLPDGVSPLATGAATMAIGGIVLFIASFRGSIAVLRDRLSRRWNLIGSIGVMCYPLAFYSSMDLAGVAVGNVVSLGSGPVFAALIEWVAERRPLTGRWGTSTIIAVAGIILLSSSAVMLGPDAAEAAWAQPAGVVLGLVAGASYALYTYAASRTMAAGHGSTAAVGALFGVGALPLLIVLAVTGAPLVQSQLSIGISVYLILGPMVVAYLLFGYGVRRNRSTTVTTITLLEPVVATVLAVIIVQERLGWSGWLGLVMVLAGLTVLVAARRPGIGPVTA